MPEIENDPFAFLASAPIDRLPQALDEIPAEDLAFLIYSRSPQEIGEWMRDSRPSLLRDVLEQAMRLEQTPRAELYPGAQELALVLRACLGSIHEDEASLALPVEPEVAAFEPDEEPPGLRTEPTLEAVSDVALALSLEPEPTFEPWIELEAMPERLAVKQSCEVELSYEGEPARTDSAVAEAANAKASLGAHQAELEEEAATALTTEAALAAEAVLAAQAEFEDEAELVAEGEIRTLVVAPSELTTTIYINPMPIEVAAPLHLSVAVPTPPPFRDYERMIAKLMNSPARRREARILDFLQRESPELSALLGEADYFRIDDQISESVGYLKSALNQRSSDRR
jgi:hypothetical protein